MTTLPDPGRAARRFLATVTIAAGAAALASSASPATPPGQFRIQTVSIEAGRVAGPFRVVLTGHITCTRTGHFQIYGFLAETSQGGFARAKLPPKTTPGTPAYNRFKQLTRCTGAPQPWSAVAIETGSTRIAFVKG